MARQGVITRLKRVVSSTVPPADSQKLYPCREEQMSEGWIKLHRKMLQWEWFTEPNTLQLFLYCLMRANHAPAKWRGISIDAGQFITSVPHISKDTGLGVQSIRTSLKRLISTGELTRKITNKYSLISICNWDEYQDANSQANSQLTVKQQSTNSQLTTNKNINNNKNKKNNKNQRGDILNFDIERLLDDRSRQAAKSKAPGWDLYYLIPIFNKWIVGKPFPDNPVGAFINWCGCYTKGKQL